MKQMDDDTFAVTIVSNKELGADHLKLIEGGDYMEEEMLRTNSGRFKQDLYVDFLLKEIRLFVWIHYPKRNIYRLSHAKER